MSCQFSLHADGKAEFGIQTLSVEGKPFLVLRQTVPDAGSISLFVERRDLVNLSKAITEFLGQES